MVAKKDMLEGMNDAMLATFKAIANRDIGYVFYIFDKSEDGGGTGSNSINCDRGDAMVAIKRIAKQFDVDLKLLGGSKMAKKETLKEEILRIHERAKQLEEELKDMGLDDVIHEQEMAVISFRISNEICGVVR